MLNSVHNSIGDFHFDSARSCSEQDFRIFIKPSDWSTVRDFCIEHFNRIDDPILETNPARELAEEFAEALKINLKSSQYIYIPVATIVENDAAPTENIYAKDIPTARVYRIFEVSITDTSLAYAMLTNNDGLSHHGLSELALEDFQNGGKGRANAILALPLKQLIDHFSSLPPGERNAPILFETNRLDETVLAVLEGITIPKYQRQ